MTTPAPAERQLLDVHLEHDPGERRVKLTQLIDQLAGKFVQTTTGEYREDDNPVIAVEHRIENGVMVVEMILHLRLLPYAEVRAETAPVVHCGYCLQSKVGRHPDCPAVPPRHPHPEEHRERRTR